MFTCIQRTHDSNHPFIHHCSSSFTTSHASHPKPNKKRLYRLSTESGVITSSTSADIMRHPSPVAVLQRNVNISIGVHSTLPKVRTKIVIETAACVYQKEYTFVGVTPITCERIIQGRIVTIEFVKTTTIAFCEVEVFAREYPTSDTAIAAKQMRVCYLQLLWMTSGGVIFIFE